MPGREPLPVPMHILKTIRRTLIQLMERAWWLPHSVLEAIRKAHDDRTTAVVVLSGSSAPADVDAARTGRANEFGACVQVIVPLP